ncbi:MAG: type II secretion system F family protein [Acidobacteriaceae bacterium]|nr:type II secretion system F family protein [Acidobacteriaceae bacterium]
MLLLVISFLLIATLCFSIVMLVLRPSKTALATDRRLRKLLAAPDPASLGKRGASSSASGGPLVDLLEAAVRDTSLLRRLEVLLLRAQSSQRPGTIIAASIGLGLLVLVVALALNAPLLFSLLIAAGSIAIPVFVLRFLGQRRLAAFDLVLADCIDMCARALRAGHSLTGAIGMVADEAPEPAKTEFAEIFRKQSYGLGLREALMQALERMPSVDLQVVVTGMLVQKETGGNLVELMERLSSLIRERARIQREVRTHTAQGRITGWILCMLPVGLLLIINIMSPGYSKPLFEEEGGKKLLYIGMGLLAAGGFTIRRIVRGIEV